MLTRWFHLGVVVFCMLIGMTGRLHAVVALQDAFDSSTPLFNDGFFTNMSASNAAATGPQLNETAPVGSTAHSMWVTWRSSYTGWVNVSTKGTNFDTTVAVYTGTSLGTLALQGYNDEYTYGDVVSGGRTSLAVVSVNAGTVYRIQVMGYRSTDVGTIRLSVQQTPTVSAGIGSHAREGVSDGSFTFTFGNTVVDQIPIDFSVTGGSATANSDYTIPLSPVTMPASTSSTSITISTAALNDVLVEGNETIAVTITPQNAPFGSSASTKALVSGTVNASMIIVDDDQPVVFVDPAAGGTNSGTSWANAYTSLATAAVNVANGNQVWVKQGTYKPTTGTDRNISFSLRSGIAYYGGFAGTETSLSQRDPKNRPTILSGDIGTIGTATDNTLSVVKADNVSGFSFDGFVVRDGYGAVQGGGIFCNFATGTFASCWVLNNRATFGAGLYNQNGSLTVSSCVFSGNTATDGSTTGHGGGVYNYSGSGGVYTNCVFANNTVLGSSYGGAGVFNESTSVGTNRFVNCTFANNAANSTAGGGAYQYGSGSPAYVNCIFWGNTASSAAQIANLTGGTSTATNCDIQGGVPTGTTDSGGNINADPQFIASGDLDGTDNVITTGDDGYTVSALSPCVNAGTSSGAPSSDIVGRVRPQGPRVDIGAYEVPVVYVSSLAIGGNNGQSWTDAYTSLATAMAATSGPAEFWVRSGTYRPTTGADRTASFVLRTGQALYGGFSGVEDNRNKADARLWPTVLSGDIGAIGTASDNSYHVVTTAGAGAVIDGFVIRDGMANGSTPNNFGGGLYPTANCTVNNCAFIANGATYGGAMFANGALMTVSNCFFVSNQASQIGGAVYQSGGAGSTYTNCVFANNAVSGGSYGGGGLFTESGITLTNCTFAGNTAAFRAGGLHVWSGASTLRNCLFWGNTGSPSTANQIFNESGSSTAINCLVQGGLPTGTTNGGGLVTSDPLFVDSSDPIGRDNILGTGDDGLNIIPSSPARNAGNATGIPSGDVAGNSRSIGAAPDIGAYERLTVLYVDKDAAGVQTGLTWNNAYRNLVDALSAASSGVNEVWVADGTYYPSTTNDRKDTFRMVDRVAVYGGFSASETSIAARAPWLNRTVLSGDIDQDGTSANNSYHVVRGAQRAILDGLVITGGNADGSGPAYSDYGGGLYDGDISGQGQSTVAINCIFTDNQALFVGGAIHAFTNGATQARGCLFTGNQAGYGGAVFFWFGSGNLVNCTFTGNRAANYGGTSYIYFSQVTVGNCIMWGDSSPGVFNNNSLAAFTGTDLQGSGGSGGSWDTSLGFDAGGNLDKDPAFLKESDPAGGDGLIGTDDDGLRLAADSPCINNGVQAGGPRLDLLGNARPSGSAPDSGAYEGKVTTVQFALSSSSGSEAVASPTISLVLAETSDIPVTVTYQVAAGGTATNGTDYTVGVTTLTFSPGETSKPLNLAITNDTVQEVDETIVFSIAGVTNARISGTTSHTYTILNNDTAGITTSPTTLTVNESGTTSQNFTLSLNTTPAPGTTVSVVVTSSAPAEGTLSYGALTGQTSVTVVWDSGSNGYGPKVVTVTSVNDAIDDGDFTFNVTTAPATSSDPFYVGKDAADVSVTNIDDDTVGINVSKASVSVSEAGAGDTFVVTLASQPTANVTVNVSSSNTADATVSPSVLTFTPSDWNLATGHTVTVTAVNDSVDEVDSPLGSNNTAFTITLDAVSSDLKYDPLARTVSGTLVDNDTAAVNITPSATQTPSENGGTITYNVVLATQPSAAVTIGTGGTPIASSATGQGTVSPTTLTFGTGTGLGGWNTPQTVTVTAVNNDSVGANPSYTVTFPAPTSTDAKYSVLAAIPRTLQNADDDVAGVLFSPTAGLTTTELGGTATFTARLTSKPTANVTFTITALQSAVPAYEGQLSVDGGTTYAADGGTCSFTFTPTNGQAAVAAGTSVTAGWNTPVTVTIRGLDNGVVTGNQTYAISRAAASSTDGNYNTKFANAAAVTVINQSKDAPGVTVNPGSVSVTEAAGVGHTADVTVKLNYPPTNNVTVALSVGGAAQATLSTSSLLFTPGNFSTPQTVTVTATDDYIDDGDVAFDVTFTVTSVDVGYNGIAVTPLAVTNVDDDVRGISVSPQSGLTTTEAGGQAAFTVVLTSQPTAGSTVSVPLHTTDASEGLVRIGSSGAGASNITLTFNASDWNVPKLVTVVGVDDAIADGSQAYDVDFDPITATGGGDYDGTTTPASVSVTNLDNDTALVVLSRTSFNLDEAPVPASPPPPHSDTYTLVLNSQPTADVVITLDAGSKATVDTDTGTVGDQVAVTFTASGFPTPTAYAGGIKADWNVPLTVTVTAVDDVVADGAHDAVIAHTAVSGDSAYGGISIANCTVHITDNDVPGISPSPASGLVTSETAGGSSASLSYVLTTKPRSNVTLLLSSSQPGEAVPVPDRITFTPSNYNVAGDHTIQVTGVDDETDDGAQAFQITGVLVSADTAYDGLTVPSVSGSNTDDDANGVQFTVTTVGTPLVTTESGGTATFQVRLTAKPSGNVTVTLTTDNAAEGRFGSATTTSLTFTTSDWDVNQIVTVTGQHDSVDESPGATPVDTAYTVTVGPAAGGGYAAGVLYNGSASLGTVHLANTDIDQAGVTITPTSGLVTSESGTTASYTVVLNSKPSATVDVNITPQTAVLVTGQPAVAQLTAPAKVTFTTSDWNVPQTVVIAAVDDKVAEGAAGTPHTGIVQHSITSGDTTYAALTVSNVTALITDNDAPGLVIAATVGSTGFTTENPGDPQPTTAFSVNLASQPTGPVRVVCTSSNPQEAQLSLDGLRGSAQTSIEVTIQPADWNSLTPPVITVFGIDDDRDDGDQSVNIVFSIDAINTSDTRYDDVANEIEQVINRDDDTAAVTIVESPHGANFPAAGPSGSDLSENDLVTPYTYTLVLDAEPTAPVTITLGAVSQVTVDTDVAAGAQNTVVFTTTKDQPASGNTAGWNVPLTVTVYAIDDPNAEGTPHAGTVTHSATGGGYTGVSVASVTMDIADNDQSTPPVVAWPSANPFAYDEQGHLARVIDALATVTDGDSPNFQSGNIVVAITGGLVAAQDELAVRSQGTGAGEIGVSGTSITYNPLANTGAVAIGTLAGGTAGADLVITLNSIAASNVSLEAVQALLRNLTYRNSSLNPVTAPRTITLTVNDGDGGTSTPVTKSVTITTFDDAPIVPDQAIVTVVDQTITGTLVANDPEGLALTFTKLSDPSDGTLTLNPDGTYEYQPLGGDFANTYTFQVEARDPAMNVSTAATITIHITGGSEARPQLLSAPPMEGETGPQSDVLYFDPASKLQTVGNSQLRYRVVDLDPGITATVTPLSNTPTSVTARLNWELPAGGTALDHFTFGIIVIDVDQNAATYIPVTIQLVPTPGGPG